jgi:ketosteroid isomerase-like protein
MEDDWQDRLVDVERRVLELEDQVAILGLINRWGPAVDTGSSEAAGALFDTDGVLESDLARLVGPDAVRAMVQSEGQQALIRRGCAHVQTAPVVAVDGDTATAVSYSQVYLHADDGHDVWRVSANQWEFRRTADGWRVTRRLNRVIDGNPDAHPILERALDGPR